MLASNYPTPNDKVAQDTCISSRFSRTSSLDVEAAKPATLGARSSVQGGGIFRTTKDRPKPLSGAP